jgi:hypothetical protein
LRRRPDRRTVCGVPVVFAAFDPIAAVIALAALIVSGATLYLTVLRHAEIEVDTIRRATGLRSSGFHSASHPVRMPRPPSIELRLFVSHGGASSAVLEDAALKDFACVSDGDPLWSDIVHVGHFDAQVPLAMEVGDAKTVQVAIGLAGAPADPTEYARRLGGLRRLRLTLEWTYARSRSPLWGLLPDEQRPDRRQLVTESLPITIDCTAFREEAIAFWAAEGGPHAALAEAARG